MEIKKLFSIIVFSLAFGLLEAIVVVYLRKILGPNLGSNFNYLFLKDSSIILDLKAITFILPTHPILKNVEISTLETLREFATIAMLLSVGYLSAQSIKQRIGAFLIAFGFWDIFYYIFLNLLISWPKNVFDIDVFFLIPVPWVGPVITPIAISTLLIIIGVNLFLKKNNSKRLV